MRHLYATVYQADEGKIFKNKDSGEVLDGLILLAVTDGITNYEEVTRDD